MKRLGVLAVLLAVCVFSTAWVVFTQTAKPARPLRQEKVKDNLYMVSGEGGNVAIYVTPEGVILVDDMFDRNHADIIAQVKAVTDQPLKYVINTHQHDDHAGGDAKMLPLAEVIAHKNARANLVAKRQPYYEDTPGTPIGLPRITFSDETAVHLGGREVRAQYFGRGHTNGDAVISFSGLRVIHTGDLFLGQNPGRPGAPRRPPGSNIFIDYAQGGSLVEWARTLDGVLSLDFDIAIPGHGPVSTRTDVMTFRAGVDAMRGRLADLIKHGASRDEVVNTLESDYGWKAKGCPPSPPTGGCLAIQQVDALIAELRAAR